MVDLLILNLVKNQFIDRVQIDEGLCYKVYITLQIGKKNVVTGPSITAKTFCLKNNTILCYFGQNCRPSRSMYRKQKPEMTVNTLQTVFFDHRFWSSAAENRTRFLSQIFLFSKSFSAISKALYNCTFVIQVRTMYIHGYVL